MKNEEGFKSDIGNLHCFLENYRLSQIREYSYDPLKWRDFEDWKKKFRKKVGDLLSYTPNNVQLESQILEVIEKKGFRQEEVEFNTAENVRVRASVLIPQKKQEKYPAVIAMHDHSGFYYYGREKIIEADSSPNILNDFKEKSYEGKSWANELARRGYVVICIDAFYFGSRRLLLEDLNEEYYSILDCEKLSNTNFQIDDYISKYNEICYKYETIIMKHILNSGSTWLGILLHDDRKCIDYLYSRGDVDKERIGCCGLSVGGYRSAFLSAIDERISCSLVVGWLSTYESLLRNKQRFHTFMLYVPGLPRNADLSDVVALAAPKPLFIQQCSRDSLFNLDGMREACDNVNLVYSSVGASSNFKHCFYDNEHQFNVQMQNDAFDWMDKWLLV